jgi:hypothetical protein
MGEDLLGWELEPKLSEAMCNPHLNMQRRSPSQFMEALDVRAFWTRVMPYRVALRIHLEPQPCFERRM